MTDEVKSIRDRRKDIQQHASGASLADIKALEAVIKAKHPAADFADKQADLIDSVRTTPGERSFQARRRGAIQALRAVSEWALERSSEPDEENAVRAYYHCYETCMSMIDQYNEGRKAFGDEVA